MFIFRFCHTFYVKPELNSTFKAKNKIQPAKLKLSTNPNSDDELNSSKTFLTKTCLPDFR